VREIWERRENESLMDYEERLYRNRSEYGIDWEKINELLELEQHPDTTRKASVGYIKRIDQKRQNKFDKSIMIINDLHLPYEREDILEVIKKHSNEITTLVIAGDLMDCESISKFPKIRRKSLEEELIYSYEFIKKIRKILDKGQKIIIIRGNHEERLYKEICSMHKKEFQKFINPEIIEMIIDGFVIYDNGKKMKYEGVSDITYVPHWYVNIENKIIVAHPKDFSKVKGKMLESIAGHFVNRHEEFEVIVMGHTHKFSTGIVDRYAGVFVVENMCMCKPQNYSDKGKLGFTPQTYGYTIIKYNDNEKIKFDNIRTYHLDELYNQNEDYVINL